MAETQEIAVTPVEAASYRLYDWLKQHSMNNAGLADLRDAIAWIDDQAELANYKARHKCIQLAISGNAAVCDIFGDNSLGSDEDDDPAHLLFDIHNGIECTLKRLLHAIEMREEYRETYQFPPKKWMRLRRAGQNLAAAVFVTLGVLLFILFIITIATIFVGFAKEMART